MSGRSEISANTFRANTSSLGICKRKQNSHIKLSRRGLNWHLVIQNIYCLTFFCIRTLCSEHETDAVYIATLRTSFPDQTSCATFDVLILSWMRCGLELNSEWFSHHAESYIKAIYVLYNITPTVLLQEISVCNEQCVTFIYMWSFQSEIQHHHCVLIFLNQQLLLHLTQQSQTIWVGFNHAIQCYAIRTMNFEKLGYKTDEKLTESLRLKYEK